MDSFDESSDYTMMTTTDNRLMSESSLRKPEDLSISELSLSNKPDNSTNYPQELAGNPERVGEQDAGNLHAEDEEDVDPEELARRKRQSAKAREDKLQHDLFLLKKLNGAFSLYTDALMATQTSTERLKARLKNTDALLDKYIGILDQAESVTKLILDERWQGADADEEHLERLRIEVEERLLKDAEERELAERREQERLEKERQEEEEREERERIAQERREKEKKSTRGVSNTGASSGVRGVRGTRASMRARGIARGTTTISPAQPASRIARTSSVASTRGSAPVRARGSAS